MLTENDITRLVPSILSVADPAAIILYGSYARGDARERSDIDLLVVRKREFQAGESRRRELGDLYRAVSEKCSVPKDILLFTRGELATWRETTNHIASEALREGRVLYGEI